MRLWGDQPVIILLNVDCMEYMATQPDKAFDLAIVDPQYGIGADNHAGPENHGWTQWPKKAWDKKPPDKKYFTELFRISKHQIIWEGNYFELPPTKGIVVWDKGQRDFSLADGELAWSNFDKSLRIFTYSRASANKEIKIHPTQKPVALYKWLLENYAKPGQRILDTHLGSGSSAIAAHYFGVDFVGCEIDPDYFQAAQKRVKEQTRQLKLF